MDNNHFEDLCLGASPEEVKRLHKLLHDWGVGPQDSYPVQMALLTRAQWKAAASIPQLINDANKQLGQQLADHRKQTATQIHSLEQHSQQYAEALQKIAISRRVEAEKLINAHDALLAKMNSVVSRIMTKLEEAEASWKKAYDDAHKERQELNAARADLDTRTSICFILFYLFWVLTALALGYVCGHYGR